MSSYIFSLKKPNPIWRLAYTGVEPTNYYMMMLFSDTSFDYIYSSIVHHVFSQESSPVQSATSLPGCVHAPWNYFQFASEHRKMNFLFGGWPMFRGKITGWKGCIPCKPRWSQVQVCLLWRSNPLKDHHERPLFVRETAVTWTPLWVRTTSSIDGGCLACGRNKHEEIMMIQEWVIMSDPAAQVTCQCWVVWWGNPLKNCFKCVCLIEFEINFSSDSIGLKQQHASLV